MIKVGDLCKVTSPSCVVLIEPDLNSLPFLVTTWSISGYDLRYEIEVPKNLILLVLELDKKSKTMTFLYKSKRFTVSFPMVTWQDIDHSMSPESWLEIVTDDDNEEDNG